MKRWSLCFVLVCFAACSKDPSNPPPPATCSAATKTRLYTASWGDQAIRVTDDILALADGATASPRILQGSNTTINNPSVVDLAVDTTRKLIYLADVNAVKVWANADTTTGNLAPDRTFAPSGSPTIHSAAVDGSRDRLYLAGPGKVYIYANASTINGTPSAPDVTITLANANWNFYDAKNDRLYVGTTVLGSSATVAVFDAASTLTSASTPNRTINLTGFASYNLTSGALDSCRDILYLTSRNDSNGGYNVARFDNASTLDGNVDFDTGSAARITLSNAMNVGIDGNTDTLFAWIDSATDVLLYSNISKASGVVAAPSKTIHGTLHYGYGLVLESY